MSFGSDIATGVAMQLVKWIVVILAIGFVLGLGAMWLIHHL